MKELEQHIWSRRKGLVDTVETEGSDILYPSIDIANKLNEIFPLSHASIDKIHLVWSRVLRDLVWLGWISEAKRSDERYDDRICDSLGTSIVQAFQTGRRYVEERK